MKKPDFPHGIGLFRGVPGMAHLQLVKVQPRVFTAKCSETQVESSNAGMKEEASKLPSLRTETQ